MSKHCWLIPSFKMSIDRGRLHITYLPSDYVTITRLYAFVFLFIFDHPSGAALPKPSHWSSSSLCGVPEEQQKDLWGGTCHSWQMSTWHINLPLSSFECAESLNHYMFLLLCLFVFLLLMFLFVRQFIEGDFEDYLLKLQDPQVQHSALPSHLLS